jgi:hypothetical protein
MQKYVKTMWIYAFRFWLFQLALNLIAMLYLASIGHQWGQCLNPSVWVSWFISIPMWMLCLTAGALSAFGGRIWLLMAVLQLFATLALTGQSAKELESYTQLESYLSEHTR